MVAIAYLTFFSLLTKYFLSHFKDIFVAFRKENLVALAPAVVGKASG
jgi:hypothetical protein